jgi:signal peptidase
MIYFSLGLITGYGLSIYNHSILGYIQNIWIYIVPVICIEYLRNKFIKNNNNNWTYILIIIIFTLYDIPLYSFIKSGYTLAELFTKICSIVIPALATNIVLTYVSKTSGYKSTITYLIPQKIFMIVLPLLPNLDWYYVAVTGTLLPFVTYVFIKSIQDKLTNLIPKRNLKKQSYIRYAPVIFTIVLLLCFMTGIFKYEPIAILSNSMHPLYNRGDVIIIEKLDNDALNNLKEQDIIDYNLNGIFIAHRIVSVEKHNDGTVLYTTKGDNNNIIDKEKVSPDQIKGVVRFTVSKIGYPSVWISELFNKKDVTIETGN